MHVYRDWANSNDMSRSQNNDDTANEIERSSSVEHKFPVKLHYMLEDMEKDGLDHVMAWQPHGRCFIVHKPREMEKVLNL